MGGHFASAAPLALNTLILVSPIPLVQESQLFEEYSFLTQEQKGGVRYTPAEVLMLLDLVSSWLEANPSTREVIVVAGGVSQSFNTTISVERDVRQGDSH